MRRSAIINSLSNNSQILEKKPFFKAPKFHKKKIENTLKDSSSTNSTEGLIKNHSNKKIPYFLKKKSEKFVSFEKKISGNICFSVEKSSFFI